VIIVGMCFPVFFIFGKFFNPLNSLYFSFFSYWFLLLITSLFFILYDKRSTKSLKLYFLTIKKPFLILINFIPVFAVFFVAFIPVIPKMQLNIFFVVLLISLFNGTIEEIFWRGLVLSKYSESNILIIISLFLFSIFHFVFLQLPLIYHGGVINLVGGAAFMGFIWLFISKYTKNILFPIIAHIFVNFFAFSGLFIANNLL
jgi:membrane protease YdiL (CAAX protease family)